MLNDENRLHLLFTAFNRDFYESPDQYHPNDDFVKIVRQEVPPHWNFLKRNVWFNVQPENINLPVQGWKIHLSAIPGNCGELLRIVAKVCVKFNIAFKFLVDKNIFQFMNNKNQIRSASGKFITIYPFNEQQCQKILDDLFEKTRGFEGPYILSDRRYKNSKVIYYRYGSIKGISILNIRGEQEHVLIKPNGEYVLDNRVPYWSPPTWITDPFIGEEIDEGDLSLNNGRYYIKKAFGFSVTGGVYLADDLATGYTVVIKEARPHTAVDNNGIDAIARLTKEYRILSKLKNLFSTPDPVDIFYDWEHLYLVEEYILGENLTDFTIGSNPLLTILPSNEDKADYTSYLQRIWAKMAKALKEIHDSNIILGDISINNVIIKEEGEVRFIDFESAWEINKDIPTEIVTPGFSSNDLDENNGKENDIYSFGSLMLGTLFPINSILEIKQNAQEVFSETLCSELGISKSIQSLINRCMDNDPSMRPKIDEVITIIQKSIVSSTFNIMKTHKLIPGNEKAISVVDKTMSYIKGNLSLDRKDRLFPADPMIFNTNPLSVAYGAAGVLYSYYKINESVPNEWVYWLLSKPVHPSSYTPGLYTGASGIAWTLWDIGYEEESLQLLSNFDKHPLLWDSPDLFYGASGYGMSCLHLYLGTKDQKWLDRAYQVGDWLLKTKVDNTDISCYWLDKDRKTRLGYAHGASGIAIFLLYLSIISDEDRFLYTGEKALNFDLSHTHSTVNGYLSIPGGEVGKLQNVITHYWHSGSAGVGTTLLRYWFYTKNKTYMQSLKKLIPDTYKKYTASPGLFNGLAGLGNFLIDAYHFTREKKYLDEANQIANGVYHFELNRSEGTAFPGDKTLRISTDFGTGSSGIALFLHRLAYIDKHIENFNFTLDEIL